MSHISEYSALKIRFSTRFSATAAVQVATWQQGVPAQANILVPLLPIGLILICTMLQSLLRN